MEPVQNKLNEFNTSTLFLHVLYTQALFYLYTYMIIFGLKLAATLLMSSHSAHF